MAEVLLPVFLCKFNLFLIAFKTGFNFALIQFKERVESIFYLMTSKIRLGRVD